MAQCSLNHLPRYESFDPRVPVWCATPNLNGVIHRFYDTSPISPAGRFLAVTRLPAEDRLPDPGDTAEIIVVDLSTGDHRVVAVTRAWDTQLGAQVQWGSDDQTLFYNDLATGDWQPHGVRLNPVSGSTMRLRGPVYMASPDGARILSPCLLRTRRTQPGYGVIAPPEVIPTNDGAPADDGIQVTDSGTGSTELLISMADIVAALPDSLGTTAYHDGDFYGFHVKWNPQGTRILFVIRWIPKRKRLRDRMFRRGRMHLRKNLVTMNADGSNIHLALPNEVWARGGHHPNWCPDGDHIVMNLDIGGEGLRFVRFRYDGTGLAPLSPSIPGSGHPTIHRDGRYVLTDAYPDESIAAGDGTVPLRWVDLESATETTLLRIRVDPPFRGPRGELRVDPHPAWDRTFTRVAFNACPDGTRRVFVADLQGILDQSAGPC